MFVFNSSRAAICLDVALLLRHVEPLLVLVFELLLAETRGLEEVADEEARDGANTHGRRDGEELVATLLVEDAAGVGHTNGALQTRSHEAEAQHRRDSNNQADGDRRSWTDGEVAARAHGNTARESGILDVHHVELLGVAEDLGRSESRRARCRDTQHGGHDGALLLEAVAAHERRVERRPVHPQEERADHGKHVRVVSRRIVHLLVVRRHSQLNRHREAEEGAERVNDHRATGVGDAELLVHQVLVDGVEDDFEEGHPDQLSGGGLAQNSAKADEHCTGGKVAVDHGRDVEDLGVVLVSEDLVGHGHHDDTPLQRQDADEEVEGNGAHAVLAQEGHQEAETDVDHDVDVHVHGVVAERAARGLGVAVVGAGHVEFEREEDEAYRLEEHERQSEAFLLRRRALATGRRGHVVVTVVLCAGHRRPNLAGVG
ncbi:hypothetical protein ON010_g1120 [Phytophthora cinnamomi]|nr:hypothetical protein ON010_g1120 [Phytophthora cinnamomi]